MQSNVAVSAELMVLVRQMIHTHDIYIDSKIKDKSFKEAYSVTIASLIEEAHSCNNFDDYRTYVSIVAVKELEKKLSLFKRITSSAEHEGISLAFNTVQDILSSINTRFIEGGYRLHEKLFKELKGFDDVKK